MSETNTEIKTGINPVIKDYFMLKQSSVSHAKITNRLTLLHEIIRISDAHDKLLSDSACAKARLFAHWAKFEDEPKDAAQIVRLLNLNDRRVLDLDAWLKHRARLSFFPDAKIVDG